MNQIIRDWVGGVPELARSLRRASGIGLPEAVCGHAELMSDGQEHAGLVEVTIAIVGYPRHSRQLPFGIRPEHPRRGKKTLMSGKGFKKIHVTHSKL